MKSIKKLPSKLSAYTFMVYNASDRRIKGQMTVWDHEPKSALVRARRLMRPDVILVGNWRDTDEPYDGPQSG